MKTIGIAIGSAIAAFSAAQAIACCVADLRLPESDVKQLTARAEQGDYSAMSRLFQHYQLTNDAWNHAYWGERLARLNDKDVILNLAEFYDSLGTPYLCKRAIELVKQYASLTENKSAREAILGIAKHYTGEEVPNGKCGADRYKGEAEN